MLKAGSRLFQLGKSKLSRKEPAYSPPPPSYSPMQSLAPTEEKERKKTLSANTTVIFLVVGAAVIGTVVYYGVVKKKPAVESQRAEEDYLLQENARFEAEQKAYNDKRQDLLGEFQRLSKERNEIMRQLQGNFETAKRNQHDFQEMFSERKADHGDSGVESDSIDTAFMLKDDMEKKKMDMIQMGKQLGQRKDSLMRMMEENRAAINEVAQVYNSSYDGDKLPLA